MAFTNFQSFAEWCIDVEEIDVESVKEQEQGDAIVIKNLNNTNGMIVCEMLVSAYDSGFFFGPMSAEMLNGSIMIYDEE